MTKIKEWIHFNYYLSDRINRMNRIAYTRFHPETGYRKYPINPVNPVYL